MFTHPEIKSTKFGKFSSLQRFNSAPDRVVELPYQKKLAECVISDFETKNIKGVPLGKERGTVNALSQRVMTETKNFNGNVNSYNFKNRAGQVHLKSDKMLAKNVMSRQQDLAREQ